MDKCQRLSTTFSSRRSSSAIPSEPEDREWRRADPHAAIYEGPINLDRCFVSHYCRIAASDCLVDSKHEEIAVGKNVSGVDVSLAARRRAPTFAAAMGPVSERRSRATAAQQE